MADVADDRHVFHLLHVVCGDDVAVSSGSDKNISKINNFFNCSHFKTFHACLKRADGVDLGDDYSCSETLHRFRAPFADIAVAAYADDFARNHDVCSAFETVSQRFPAAVKVVEFRLRDRVVDVDCREEKGVFLKHLVKSVDTRRGFFAYTFDFLNDFVPFLRIFFVFFFQNVKYCLSLAVFCFFVKKSGIFFARIAFVDEKRRVSAVVNDELRSFAAGERKSFQRALPVFFNSFTFPRKNRNTHICDCGSGVILSRENVAACPADIGAESD